MLIGMHAHQHLDSHQDSGSLVPTDVHFQNGLHLRAQLHPPNFFAL